METGTFIFNPPPVTRVSVVALFALLVLGTMHIQAQTSVPATLEAAREQFEAADADLNKVYQRCHQALAERPAAQAALQDAQRLWVKCRDQTAEAYAGAAPIHRLEDTYRFYAETVATQSRTKELEKLFLSEDKTRP